MNEPKSVGQFGPIVRALERRDDVPERERALLDTLSLRIRTFAEEAELVIEGSEPTESCLVLTGFAGRAHFFADGRRQISAIHIAGDFVDLHSLLLRKIDHSVIALTEVQVAYVRHEDLRRVTEASPHLTRLLWMLTTIDAAIERTRIVSLGRRSSEEHFAHLVCEMYLRSKVAGLANGHSFSFPTNQARIADFLGLSPVHVNRTLQRIRGDGLIEWERGQVTILDWDRLARLAEFDPTYLNLLHEPR